MHSKTCIEALYILFSHVPFPQNKRGLIWRYTTIHTFHEFEVECRCSIIILFQCSYHIIFYYHLMFAEVSIFSTRVFFQDVIYAHPNVMCLCMCMCVCVLKLCATIFYHRLFTNETDFMCTKNKIDEQNIKRWCGIKKRWTMEVF